MESPLLEPQGDSQKLAQISAKVPQSVYDQILQAVQDRSQTLGRQVYNTEVINQALAAYFAPNPALLRLQELETELATARQTIQQLEQQTQESETVSGQVRQLQQENTELTHQLQEATGRINELTKELDSWQSAGAKSNTSLQNLRDELSKTKAQRDDYKARLQESKSVHDIKLMTTEQSAKGLQTQINAIGDLAIKSGMISQSSVLKVAPNYVPRKQRN